MQLIIKTGGLAVLAHPWALKNPVAVTRRLKDAGLHGMEVYRSDGKLAGIFFKFKMVPYLLFDSIIHWALYNPMLQTACNTFIS